MSVQNKYKLIYIFIIACEIATFTRASAFTERENANANNMLISSNSSYYYGDDDGDDYDDAYYYGGDDYYDDNTASFTSDRVQYYWRLYLATFVGILVLMLLVDFTGLGGRWITIVSDISENVCNEETDAKTNAETDKDKKKELERDYSRKNSMDNRGKHEEETKRLDCIKGFFDRKYRLGTKGCCSDKDWVKFEDEYSDYFKGCLLNGRKYYGVKSEDYSKEHPWVAFFLSYLEFSKEYSRATDLFFDFCNNNDVMAMGFSSDAHPYSRHAKMRSFIILNALTFSFSAFLTFFASAMSKNDIRVVNFIFGSIIMNFLTSVLYYVSALPCLQGKHREYKICGYDMCALVKKCFGTISLAIGLVLMIGMIFVFLLVAYLSLYVEPDGKRSVNGKALLIQYMITIFVINYSTYFVLLLKDYIRFTLIFKLNLYFTEITFFRCGVYFEEIAKMRYLKVLFAEEVSDEKIYSFFSFFRILNIGVLRDFEDIALLAELDDATRASYVAKKTVDDQGCLGKFPCLKKKSAEEEEYDKKTTLEKCSYWTDIIEKRRGKRNQNERGTMEVELKNVTSNPMTET